MERDYRRQFLDEPFILECMSLEHVRDLLRPLAQAAHTSLPARLRNHAARLHREVSGMLRELRQRPAALQAEREAEEGTPPAL
jgi:hypothetical protein